MKSYEDATFMAKLCVVVLCVVCYVSVLAIAGLVFT